MISQLLKENEKPICQKKIEKNTEKMKNREKLVTLETIFYLEFFGNVFEIIIKFFLLF